MTDAPVVRVAPLRQVPYSIPQTMLPVHRKIRRGTRRVPATRPRVAVPGLCRPAAEQRPRCRGRGAGDLGLAAGPSAGSPRLPGGTDSSRRLVALAVVAMEAGPPGRSWRSVAFVATPSRPSLGGHGEAALAGRFLRASARDGSCPGRAVGRGRRPCAWRGARTDCAHVGTGNNYRQVSPGPAALPGHSPTSLSRHQPAAPALDAPIGSAAPRGGTLAPGRHRRSDVPLRAARSPRREELNPCTSTSWAQPRRQHHPRHLLGGGAAVESLGEIVSGLERFQDGEPCACGAAMRDCSFWSGVRRRRGRGPGLGRACRTQPLADRRPPLAHDPARSHGRTEAGAACGDDRGSGMGRRGRIRQAARARLEQGDRARPVPAALPARGAGHPPRARPARIQQSHGWRITGSDHGIRFMRRHWRSAGAVGRPLLLLLLAASWTVGNALCELVASAAPRRVLRVRYEDLRGDLAGALRRIGATFGLPLEDVACAVEHGVSPSWSVSHNVGAPRPLRGPGPIRRGGRAGALPPALGGGGDPGPVAPSRYGYPLRAATSGGPVPSGRARPGTG